ncbi:MAG: single-stranded DNA-binding protein [Acidobacteria bacterium]|nr:single-stranded DNA-binding protein [Acidobacteriota bacterium]
MSQRKYTIAKIGARTEEFLKRILPLMGVNVRFEITEGEELHPGFENPEIRVKFSGHDVPDLLENKAEVLLALEHLTMEALRIPFEDHSRICFDANDHRMLRIEELRQSAVTAAERVRDSKRPFRFNPMNSRERRIIHLALRDFKEVRSESEGFEPRRNVVIYPEGMPSQPASAPPPMRRGRR